MLELRSNDLYRMKGVLAIQGFEERFVFQVGHVFAFLFVFDILKGRRGE